MGNLAVAYQSENTGVGLFFGDHKILLFITQSLKYHIDERYYIILFIGRSELQNRGSSGN